MGLVNIEVNVTKDANLEYIADLCGGLPAYLEKYLWQRLLVVAQNVAEESKTLAPVRTGHMRDNIVAVIEFNGIAIRCEVPYAKFQEYGTRYILPKMFMNTAMQDHYEEIRQTVVDVIQAYFQTVKP